MTRRFPRLLMVPLLSGLLIAAAVPAHAGGVDTLWVDDDGHGGPSTCTGADAAFTEIQDAVDDAGPGDTVIVCPGTYEETVVIDGNREGMTLRGSSAYAAIIQAPRSPGSSDEVLEIDEVNRVTLQWLVFRLPTNGPCTEYEDVIDINASHGVRIRSVHIRTSGDQSLGTCGYNDGIDLDDSRWFRITSSIVRDFKSDGVSADNSHYGRVLGNSFRYLHDGYAFEDNFGSNAVDINDSRAVHVSHNVIRTGETYGDGPDLEDGIDLDGVDGGRVRSNQVRGVEYGIYIESSQGVRVTGNRVTDNRKGIDVNSGDNVIRDNDARGNADDDCSDETSGGGTAGTDNEWLDNQGDDDDPLGICTER